jgi:adenosylhomocysteine nucleosidase
MRILVTFALPAEFAPWRDRHGFRRRSHVEPLPPGGSHVFEAQGGDCDVGVLLTGVGCRGARFALHHALQSQWDLCISSGLAGGLRDGLKITEVVVARKSVERRTRAHVMSSASLVATAASCGAKIAAISLTSDELAVTAQHKRQLSAEGDIVEMESYHVLRAAAGAGVPAVVVRAVSDTVEEDLPMNFDRVLDADGDLSVRRLLGSVLRQPGMIPALARFGKKSHRAAGALADFLDRYIGAFDPQWENAKSMALRQAAR